MCPCFYLSLYLNNAAYQVNFIDSQVIKVPTGVLSVPAARAFTLVLVFVCLFVSTRVQVNK